MSDKTISFDVEDLSVGVRGARSQVEDFLASKARRAMDVSVEPSSRKSRTHSERSWK